MTDRIELAARNNALWCDAVCRSHRLSGTLDSVAWSSSTRTPPLYPDAVTLSATPHAADILRRIDGSAGASVKDSWTSLDLAAAGFTPVIDGEWLWLDPVGAEGVAAIPAADQRRWRSLESGAEMAQWSRAWAQNPQHATILRPQLLHEAGVHVLAAGDGDDDFVAGCIVNVTGEVAGLSNLFSSDGDDARTWSEALSAASPLAPGRVLVGWESGDGVDAARSAGFETIGPLTVWIR